MKKSSVVLMVPQNKKLFGTITMEGLGLFPDPEMPSGKWMFLLWFFCACYLFCFYFCLCQAVHGILVVPCPGIEPVTPAVEVRRLHHWTTREVPPLFSNRETKH